MKVTPVKGTKYCTITDTASTIDVYNVMPTKYQVLSIVKPKPCGDQMYPCGVAIAP